jgi:putative AlgH/UPF0301 family transcriptional regulator
VVINKPAGDDAAFYDGGPVQPERQIAIYTTDITLPEGKLIGTTGLAYVEGGDIAALENASPPPMWSRVYKGYAGWERKQLNREINQDRWIVIDYNEKLLLETPVDKIWGDAQAAATADKSPEEPQKRQMKM